MPHWLTNLLITKVSVVPRGANPEAHILLFKAADASPSDTAADISLFATPPSPKEKVTMKIDRTKLTKEEGEYLDQLEAAVAKAAETPAPTPAPEDVLKELPEAVRKMLDEQTAAIAKANERAEAAERAAAVEKEARERADFAKTAETLIGALPGTAAQKGDTLYAVAKAVPADVYTKVVELLKAGNAAVETGTLAEIGDSTASGTGSTAFEKLATLAKEAVAKGQHRTFEQAFDAACQAHVELWKEYRQENRRTVVAQ